MTDLMHQDEIRHVVRSTYAGLPAGAGRAVAARFYGDDELAPVPETTITWSLGVGNPVRHAGLRPGDHVVDLGCGGGIDTVLAAHAVGPTGRVVGVDTLPEMCERARSAVVEAGVADRCEILQGEMEDLPLPDDHVDVVISNGVVNLSPRKSRALAEAARVLRPDGRFCVADLTVDEDLPPEVLSSGAAWAGCVAGALSEEVFTRKLQRAGFTDVRITEPIDFSLDDVASYPLFTPEVVDLMRRLLPPAAQQHIATSVIVHARRAIHEQRPSPPGPAPRSHVRRLEDVPPEAIELDGVRVRALKHVEDVAFKVLEVADGRATPFHTHLHAHEGLVVSGSGALQLQDTRLPLRPGDVFSVRPNEPHAIHGDGPELLRLVCLDCLVE